MYYDLLAKIKNATLAKRDQLHTPYSKMDYDIARILVESKYLKDVQKKTIGRQQYLEVKLALGDRRHRVNDFKIVSKPSRHMYIGYRALMSVKQGFGLGVLSTPKGLMTHREAKKQKVGGEYLFQIW
jgi:small subunit ribosomal protein S8